MFIILNMEYFLSCAIKSQLLIKYIYIWPIIFTIQKHHPKWPLYDMTANVRLYLEIGSQLNEFLNQSTVTIQWSLSFLRHPKTHYVE